VELEIARAGFLDEDDPVSLWTTVIELGALSAQAIGAKNGGSWAYNAKAYSVLPLTYQSTYNGEPGAINPLGKALKFIREKGGGEQPSAFVRFLAEDGQ
jgi:hypothetical protein